MLCPPCMPAAVGAVPVPSPVSGINNGPPALYFLPQACAGRKEMNRSSRSIEVVEDDAGKTTTYHRHPNGGGLLGPGAQVEADSFIGATSYVEVGAHVGAACRIGHGSWIDRQVMLGDHVIIGDDVHVGRGTVLGSGVHVGSHSRIGIGALIGCGVRLLGDSLVPDGARVPRARSSWGSLSRTKTTSGERFRAAA